VSYSKSAPLQIPGPSAAGITTNDSSDPNQNRRRAETDTLARQWGYPDGWPTPLEESFFVYPTEALPSILVSMGEQSKRQSAQQRRLILTRSADECAFGNKKPSLSSMEPFSHIMQGERAKRANLVT